ncbi:MAG TPA: cation-translocating P-type ATPase [Bacteroidia bacterium]|nr:cation-translocating P-type ATPase [Bacteroidia bacterium]HRH08899.1 cation-translocating P-type ATPase [Bacteroidia bacterium]
MSEIKKITLEVEGMTCSNCAATVTKALQKKGLHDVKVSFIEKEVSFELTPSNTLDDITSSIGKLGYTVVQTKKDSNELPHFSSLELKFYFSLLFTLPLFLSMWLPFHWLHNPLVQLILCTPVFILGMRHFGKSAWGSVRMKNPNMDVLICIGSIASFVYSLAGMYLYSGSAQIHNFLFFETTATIITLVLLGNLIEDKSVKQTGSAIRELVAMRPQKATIVIQENGIEQLKEVNVADLLKFDILQVNTGDKIAADGNVISGAGSADESFITGESIPVEKKVSDKVIGGSILVSGQLRIRTTKVGKESILSQLIDLVKNAQNEKPRIQKFGDKVSAIFVPVVIALSLLTFLLAYFIFETSLQQAFLQSIAVLVVSCPCAMGLATPTAVMSGIGRAAKNQVLIKGGNTLEEFASIKTIVFDKTGTLTTGNFTLKLIQITADVSEQKVKDIIFSMESFSSHPIAKSLVRELKSEAKVIQFSEVQEEKGLGIKAIDMNGDAYFIGHSRNISNSQSIAHNELVVLKNKVAIAKVTISDDVKSSALTCITKLKQLGITPVLLSGDSKNNCEEVAHKLGIKEVYFEQSPEQKLNCIKKLKLAGPIAMVGDGINDAPALNLANVGISLGNATQVAIESAQIVLLRANHLEDIEFAFRLSKTSLSTIKQNLFWAFFYNVIAIPIAAMGFLNPMLAALSMAFSDVMVVGNSIWLKTKKLL